MWCVIFFYCLNGISHQLKSCIMTISVELISFGFHFGQPKDTNKNFNLRTLPNPPVHLRKKYTGQHKALQNELFNDNNVLEFVSNLLTQLELELENCKDNESVRLGFGCQEGKHRSVAVVEYLGSKLQANNSNLLISISHRDISRNKKQEKQRK